MAEGLIDPVPDMPDKLSFKDGMQAAMVSAFNQGRQAAYSDRPRYTRWQFIGVCLAMFSGAGAGMLGMAWLFRTMMVCGG